MGILGRLKIMYRILLSLHGSVLIHLGWLQQTLGWKTEPRKGSLERELQEIPLSHDLSLCLGFISTFGDTGRCDLKSVSEVSKKVKTKEAMDEDNLQVKSLTPGLSGEIKP